MTHSIRTTVVLVLLISAALVGTLLAQNQNSGRVPINISVQNDVITVQPSSVAISRSSEQARWHVTGAPLGENRRLVVTGKTSSCFSQSSFSPTRGTPALSGDPTCEAGTTWLYDVTLYEGDTVIVVLDPELVINP